MNYAPYAGWVEIIKKGGYIFHCVYPALFLRDSWTEFTYKIAGKSPYLKQLGQRIVVRSFLDWVLQWSMI